MSELMIAGGLRASKPEVRSPVAEQRVVTEAPETPIEIRAAPSTNPIRENGARTSIVLRDGTAIVGGRFHGETLQEAIRLGVATEGDLANGTSGFTRPDGYSWNLQGTEIPVKRIVDLSEASAGVKALPVREQGTVERTERTTPPSGKPEEVARETGTSVAASESPKPGLISGTVVESWADRVIKERGIGSGALNALDPELLAAYSIKGAAIIERGVRDFAKWSSTMIEQYGERVEPFLKDIFAESQRSFDTAVRDSERSKVRKFAERAQVAPEVAEPVQAAIKASPTSEYTPQRVAGPAGIAETVKNLTDEELKSVPIIQPDGQKNQWTAAQLELSNREMARGTLEGDARAFEILEGIASTGTTMGQLINQMKLLTSSHPVGIVTVIKRELSKAGEPPMSAGEQVRLMRTADNMLKAAREVNDAEKAWRKNPTEENLKALEERFLNEIEASSEFHDSAHAIRPRTLPDVLTQTMQGNMLTPRSLGVNVADNILRLSTEWAVRPLAAAFDSLDSMVRDTPRTITVAPTKTIPASLEQLQRTFPEAVRILKRGFSDEAVKLDILRGLHPLLAMRDIWTGAAKDRSPAQRRALMAEATFGLPATPMLRALAAGDVLSRHPVRARLIAEQFELRKLNAQRELKKLKDAPPTPENLARISVLEDAANTHWTKADVRAADIAPDMFFPPEVSKLIEAESRGAVLQQESGISRGIFNLIDMAPPWGKFAIRAVAPFITTPINWIRYAAGFLPIISQYQMVKAMVKGDKRAASTAASKGVIGSMVMGLGWKLYEKGIVNPQLDIPEEQNKFRQLGMAAGLEPGHINLSAIERWRKGESTQWQAGDKTSSLAKLGLPGFLMLTSANVGRLREKSPESASTAEFATSAASDAGMLLLNYGINQSFLQGANTLLKAITEGRTDEWFKSYAESLMSIAVPNSFTSVQRAQRDFKPSVKADSKLEMLGNIVKAKLGQTEGLLKTRDLWGRAIPETPEGSNPLIYHLLDFTRNREVSDDPVSLAVYSVWRHTADSRVVPTPPDKSLSIARQTYQLTAAQHNRLQELVGAERYRLVNGVVTRPQWLQAEPEQQAIVLERLYTAGAAAGKAKFLQEFQGELTAKQKPAGFRIK